MNNEWLIGCWQIVNMEVLHPPPVSLDMKPPILQPTEIPTSSSSQHFNLNFTITNLPYSHDIAQPGTTKHQQNKRSIEYAVRIMLLVHLTPRQKLTVNTGSVGDFFKKNKSYWKYILIPIYKLWKIQRDSIARKGCYSYVILWNKTSYAWACICQWKRRSGSILSSCLISLTMEPEVLT